MVKISICTHCTLSDYVTPHNNANEEVTLCMCSMRLNLATPENHFVHNIITRETSG